MLENEREIPKFEVCHGVSKALNLKSTHLRVKREVLEVKRTGSFDGQPDTPQDVTSVHDPRKKIDVSRVTYMITCTGWTQTEKLIFYELDLYFKKNVYSNCYCHGHCH